MTEPPFPAHGDTPNTEPPADPPVAYFITFRTYGTWLPGEERGSIDDRHNAYGSPAHPPVRSLESNARGRLKRGPVDLEAAERLVVDRMVRAVCEQHGWGLRSLNVRTNHVHVVVSASVKPEHVMNVLKSWSTRRLVENGFQERGASVWARHGSTRYLWTEAAVEAACRYVEHGQD